MTQHFTSLEGVNLNNTWLTIGSFDGVHLGHQHLISQLHQEAHQAGASSVVLTFHPHPALVLMRRTGPFYLTTKEEKAFLLAELGVDVVITHPFTYEVSQSSARDFINYLFEHLGFKHLWVGSDFALGKGREGNVNYLKELATEFDYQVKVVAPVMMDGRVISSSMIRAMLNEGRVEDAKQLLGRPYQLSGEVIHGDGRGKSIGVPTANLETGNEKLIPGAGVYACNVIVSNKHLPAAVNIGTRPTFEHQDSQAHVEAYILDFSGDLYTQTISLEFITRLRGEEKFASVSELIKQIHVDIENTREIIGERLKE
jgi:riboflavin kinase / FMN adenylyltransferase